MQSEGIIWILVSILGVVFVGLFLTFAFYASKIKKSEFERTGKHPRGYYSQRGLAIGVAIGSALGVSMDNIAIGIGIGIALGTAMGATQEKKHAAELRPLTEKEKQLMRTSLYFITGTFVLGILAFLAAMWFK